MIPRMKTAFLILTAALLLSALPRAAEQTWTGNISDSACGKKHEEAAEGNGVMPDRETGTLGPRHTRGTHGQADRRAERQRHHRVENREAVNYSLPLLN